MLDPGELTGWFEAHAAPLVLYARQWLDRGAAEDVVQEAFVRLMLQGRPPDNLKAWLYRAVRNHAISRWRSTQRRHHRERRAAAPEMYFEPHHGDPIDAETAAAALRQLSKPQREVMVLRIWAAMTLSEISLLIGSPVSTVFHHYQEGLRVLREKMGVTCQTNYD